MSYFVQLNETSTTLNLEQISSIEWNSVCEELQGTNYTTTVSLSNGGGYYLTENDARNLWKALQRYNQFIGSTGSQSHTGQNNSARDGLGKVQSSPTESD